MKARRKSKDDMPERKSQIVAFYENKIKLRGNSELKKIDYIHKHWSKDYQRLERYHGYIQWVFPNKVRSMFNSFAPVITDEDCEVFKKSPEIRQRMIKTSIMMLDFWGFALEDDRKEEEIVLKRCANWETQLRNLYGHNLLRVTRMLKCWGLVGMESWQRPFILRCMFEVFLMGELEGSLDSMRRFWITSVVDDNEKDALKKHFKFLTIAVTKGEEFEKLARYPAFEAFRNNTPEFQHVFNEKLKTYKGEKKSNRINEDEKEDLKNRNNELAVGDEVSSVEAAVGTEVPSVAVIVNSLQADEKFEGREVLCLD